MEELYHVGGFEDALLEGFAGRGAMRLVLEKINSSWQCCVQVTRRRRREERTFVVIWYQSGWRSMG